MQLRSCAEPSYRVLEVEDNPYQPQKIYIWIYLIVVKKEKRHGRIDANVLLIIINNNKNNRNNNKIIITVVIKYKINNDSK